MLDAGRRGEEAWLLPYPADGGTTSRTVLADLPSFGGTPTFQWPPDSRHVVLSLQPAPDAPRQLWLADTTSNKRSALTSGTTGKNSPSVSPDGSKLIFSEQTGNFDGVSVDLATKRPAR